jgi:hypothetical protein
MNADAGRGGFETRPYRLLLFEKGRPISQHLLIEQGICRNPPVPPFEKGGRRGDLSHFKKRNSHTKNEILSC